VLVTTPQAVSLSDVSKELSFARKTQTPVLGLIENMAGYMCPHCNEITPVFGIGGGEEFCRLEQEKVTLGTGEGCKFLGRVPIDIEFVKLMDNAARVEGDGSLVERYKEIPTYGIFKEICQGIVDAVHGPMSS